MAQDTLKGITFLFEWPIIPLVEVVATDMCALRLLRRHVSAYNFMKHEQCSLFVPST